MATFDHPAQILTYWRDLNTTRKIMLGEQVGSMLGSKLDEVCFLACSELIRRSHPTSTLLHDSIFTMWQLEEHRAEVESLPLSVKI